MSAAGTVAERAARGRAARAAVPRSSHAAFEPGADRPDPVSILEQQATTRVPELVPIRYGRMLVSPFAFFRGAAAIMASDLAATPRSGFEVQCCGDAHLANFGVFASPERRLVFDINDFDETLPGPWEWDVKRLTASLVIAARQRGFAVGAQERIALACAEEYRKQMARFAASTNLEVWYTRVDIDAIAPELAAGADAKTRKQLDKLMAKARTRDSAEALSKLTYTVDGAIRIVSQPPLIIPLAEIVESGRATDLPTLQRVLAAYRRSLQANRRVLLESYEVVDVAHKVVGVGSVGTQAWIALFLGRDQQDPLFLQLKQAQASVLEPFVRRSAHRNAGHRVVAGQRLMQATSDIFLGWLNMRQERGDGRSRDFYVRQLRDWKGSADTSTMTVGGMTGYARLCAATLARAHARSGDRIAIAAYLGGGQAFDRALAAFATAYADQNEHDYAALAAAAASGRIIAKSDL